jgi:hypothetical protein
VPSNPHPVEKKAEINVMQLTRRVSHWRKVGSDSCPVGTIEAMSSILNKRNEGDTASSVAKDGQSRTKSRLTRHRTGAGPKTALAGAMVGLLQQRINGCSSTSSCSEKMQVSLFLGKHWYKMSKIFNYVNKTDYCVRL